nr:uncharacterized protein LOC115265271 [Aedes albopictus]
MSSRGRSNKGSNAGGSESGAVGSVRVVVTNETIEPEATFPGRACRVCRADDNEEMVRCDMCIKWFHFACVGVTQAIENEPWNCAECTKSVQIAEAVVNPSDGGVKKKPNVGIDGDKLQLPLHQESSDLQTPKTSNANKTGTQEKQKTATKKTAPKGLRKDSNKPHPKGSHQVAAKEPDQKLMKGTGRAKSVVSQVSSRA